MSVDYRTKKSITLKELFDGRLEKHGITGQAQVHGYRSSGDWSGEDWSGEGWLSDGENTLGVYLNGIWVDTLHISGRTNGSYILTKIAEAFDTEIYSENEPQYWGSERHTHEGAYYEAEDKYYLEIMKHVRGEPSDINKWENGMKEADFAKELVSKNVALEFLNSKKELMKAIRKEFRDRDNPNSVDDGLPF